MVQSGDCAFWSAKLLHCLNYDHQLIRHTLSGFVFLITANGLYEGRQPEAHSWPKVKVTRAVQSVYHPPHVTVTLASVLNHWRQHGRE